MKTIIGRSTNTFYTPTKNQNSPRKIRWWEDYFPVEMVGIPFYMLLFGCVIRIKQPGTVQHQASKVDTALKPCREARVTVAALLKANHVGSVVSCGTSIYLVTFSIPLYLMYILLETTTMTKAPHALLLIHLNGHRSFYPSLERLRATSRLWYIRRIFVCAWARGWWLPCVKVRKHMVVPSWTIKSG